MYEMLTGDLLFQPRKNEGWSKNDDHLAQIQELVGAFHPHFIARSPKKNKYFSKDGSMKRMPALCHYPLSIVLQMKNQLKKEEATAFAEFLEMSLVPEPELRASARKLLSHDWLNRSISKDYKMYPLNNLGTAQNTTNFDKNSIKTKISLKYHPKD